MLYKCFVFTGKSHPYNELSYFIPDLLKLDWTFICYNWETVLVRDMSLSLSMLELLGKLKQSSLYLAQYFKSLEN